MKKALCVLLLIVVFLTSCAKERSCEGCRPITTRPFNDLITSFSLYIPDESKVRKIYSQVKTSQWPGHYKIIDSIQLDGSKHYSKTYDLKDYLDMTPYKLRDTFFFRCEIRWRFSTPEYVNQDTLIY